MVAAAADPTEQRQKIACPHCGGYLSAIGRRIDVPVGTIWMSAKCPTRKCGRWVPIDIATGRPTVGLSQLQAIDR